VVLLIVFVVYKRHIKRGWGRQRLEDDMGLQSMPAHDLDPAKADDEQFSNKLYDLTMDDGLYEDPGDIKLRFGDSSKDDAELTKNQERTGVDNPLYVNNNKHPLQSSSKA